MRINISDPQLFVDDPYPSYTWLRENAPLYRDEDTGVWVVSRHEDVVQVSKDSETWSALPSVLADADHPISIICMDNPRHQRLRNLVNRGFTPRMVARLEPRVRELMKTCLERIPQEGSFDLVTSISVPIPLYIIAEMIGIPERDFERFHTWSDDLIGVAGGFNDPSVVARASKAYVEYGNYLKSIFEDRRANPQADLVSILVTAQDDGDLSSEQEAMGNDELLMFMTLLLVAGNETTRNAISGGMEALLRNPDQRDLLLAHPQYLEPAVEEILRFVSPVICFRRNATRDTELCGQRISKGEKVVMLYQSANRDPRVFDHPERFDITRQPNPHVAFGVGNHFCLGANLARMEIRVVLEELMTRFPDLALAPGREPERMASTLVRGIRSMRVGSSRRVAA
ncbi:cytochrome P450 [Myxococcota bacterium]|nr:cytochrome P450 [Myxococcota bacterium]